MKAILVVLIWSSVRPLMSSSVTLMPDMAACQAAELAVRKTYTSGDSPMGTTLSTSCTPLPDPDPRKP